MKIELKKLLAGRTKVYLKDTNRVPAAVLVPLYEDAGQWHIVFIRRTMTVKTHQGQISFPGGGREKGDLTLRDTALRESWEEIGLRREDVEVLGELDDELTKTSDYVVTPFVAAIPWPYRFTLEAREVAEVFAVPVPDLLAKTTPAPVTEMVDGRPLESYTYNYRGRVIFGATARILYKLLDIIRTIPEMCWRKHRDLLVALVGQDAVLEDDVLAIAVVLAANGYRLTFVEAAHLRELRWIEATAGAPDHFRARAAEQDITYVDMVADKDLADVALDQERLIGQTGIQHSFISPEQGVQLIDGQ